MRPIDIIHASGGRKFFLTLGCGVMCTILVWFAKIPADIFRDIIMGTVAAYITGNVYKAVKGTPDAVAQ